jgi:hypothetical protein
MADRAIHTDTEINKYKYNAIRNKQTDIDIHAKTLIQMDTQSHRQIHKHTYIDRNTCRHTGIRV